MLHGNMSGAWHPLHNILGKIPGEEFFSFLNL